ncbi:MAG: ADP-ribosylglycohydrolase family protein [Armatimonadetes bacterium]|nr:ADP-ribosylglycohydrolase family protein [Armatimonadota bacterium]
MATRREKIEGGIIGLLVGDALGVPYEFHSRLEIPPPEVIEYDPPAWFNRSHRGTPPGTWSDDGAQALCLLASLLECERFDVDDFGHRLVRWQEEGYMAVDNRVFDIGSTTSDAIYALQAGTPPLEAGPRGVNANGNGSLMRVLPLALWHPGTDEELVRDAQLQSRVTHGHLRSQVCCALYCLWARYTLAEAEDAWSRAITVLREIYSEEDSATEELEGVIVPEDHVDPGGSGYVVDCLRSALWATWQGDYETVVRSAISLGKDTDTTACVAGGIAGVRDGLGSIPLRWRRGLRGQEMVEPLLRRWLKGM